jgi:hypothetical protein
MDAPLFLKWSSVDQTLLPAFSGVVSYCFHSFSLFSAVSFEFSEIILIFAAN